jgi:AcrR family transcriptional regulator
MTGEERIRGLILERSADLFLRQGFSRVTTSELSRQIGISKKTLYRHFPSKEYLLRRVVAREMSKVAASLDTVLENSELNYVGKTRAFMQVAAGQMARIGPMLLEDIYRKAPQLWQKIDRSRQRIIFQRLEAMIMAGIDNGTIRGDVRPEVIFALLQACLQHVLTPEQISKLSLSPLDVFESVVRIIYGGLLADPAREELGSSIGASP